MNLFPYEPREHQEDILNTIQEALHLRTNLIMEAGTGTGKTVCILSPCLEYAIGHGKRVLYLTRTNSQQQQVIKELREIGNREIYGAAVQGRNSMCLLLRTEEELRGGTSEELSKACGERKRRVLKKLDPRVKERGRKTSRGCPYYAALVSKGADEIENWARKNIPTAEEFAAFCEAMSICPHEASKSLLSSAKVVTAPYIYFFEPNIRRALLDWMNCEVQDLILVVDEAHNLPDYSRELRSFDLSIHALELARKEGEEIGNPLLSDGISTADFCSVLVDIIHDMEEEYVVDEDALVPPHEFETEVMHRLKITSRTVDIIANNLLATGEALKERKQAEGKLPRSYLHSLGSFLIFWQGIESTEYVRLVQGGKNAKLVGFCLDPSLAAEDIKGCHASIHMSGTLEPLEEYGESMGLSKDCVLKRYPSPFPRENRHLLFTPDVTSKYEVLYGKPEIFDRFVNYAVEIANSFKRNTAIFFPSFKMLSAALEHGMLRRIERRCFVEEQRISQEELVRTVNIFKSFGEGGAVLLGVMGGRISEGTDFPDRELEIAVLCGLPYPKPSARQKALLNYYDIRFGKGWDYTVKAPTIRKTQQALGRLIRDEKDRGAAVILDRRAAEFSEKLLGIKESADPVSEIKKFFEHS